MPELGAALAGPERRGPLRGLVEHVPRPLRELFGYGLCSAAALALDYGLLVALTELAGLHYLIAAATGFLAGLVLVYVASVRFVFTERTLERPSVEFGVFLMIGLAGLAINQAVLWGLVSLTPLGYQFAKAPTALIVFLVNFTMRRALLFSSRP